MYKFHKGTCIKLQWLQAPAIEDAPSQRIIQDAIGRLSRMLILLLQKLVFHMIHMYLHINYIYCVIIYYHTSTVWKCVKHIQNEHSPTSPKTHTFWQWQIHRHVWMPAQGKSLFCEGSSSLSIQTVGLAWVALTWLVGSWMLLAYPCLCTALRGS